MRTIIIIGILVFLASNTYSQGSLSEEKFDGISGTNIHLLLEHSKYPWSADSTSTLNSFATTSGRGEKFGSRIRGYLTPDTSGSYEFTVNADDSAILYIGLDGTEFSRAPFVIVEKWTAYQDFPKGTKSAAIQLTAGQTYYVELVYKEHTGGDHASVAWSRDGGALEIIPGNLLAPFTYVFSEQQTILSNTLTEANNLYTTSAGNIGTSPGQYSEAMRLNFQTAITTAQAVYDTELTDAIIIAKAIYTLKDTINIFNGGIKPEALAGTPFSSVPTSQAASKAFDGKISTRFQYFIADGGFVGIDLGEGNQAPITAIKFHPYFKAGSKMKNGIFQGSSDGISYTDLYTIPSTPAPDWNEVAITDTTAYRYYRYVGSNGSSAQVAEIQFLGYSTQDLTVINHQKTFAANSADAVIDSQSLLAKHGGLPADLITFKLTQLPTTGTLKLNGVELVLNDTFTQTDIDSGNLSFSDDGTRTNGNFKLDVNSSTGGLLANVEFSVVIDSDADGLSDQQETALGTDYNDADTNDNGLSDSWENANGLDPVTDTLTPLLAPFNGVAKLSAAYLPGRFNAVTEFPGVPPFKAALVSEMDFNNSYWKSLTNNGQYYDAGGIYEGYLYVPLTGDYQFFITSDDGSRLLIDNTELINHDGIHGKTQKSATLNLTAGMHKIRAEAFRAGGKHDLLLQWKGPGRELETVPSYLFYHDPAEHQAVINSIDGDRDGLTDIVEAQLGTDPANTDTDGDLLKDGEEVNDWSTNPLLVDSDSDTISDYDEVILFRSNPGEVDITGFTELQSVNGKDFINSLGSWYDKGDHAICGSRRGYVEYEVTVVQGSVYELDIDISQDEEESIYNEMPIQLFVNNLYVGRNTATAVFGQTTTIRFITPWLPAGTHTVRVYWDNIYPETYLQLQKIKLINIDGPDNDLNGKADWLDQRLNSQCNYDEITSYKVSPICIEGNGRYMEQMAISGTSASLRRATHNRWFANIPLTAGEDNDITVSWYNGVKSKTRSVHWEETNVFVETQTMVIRKGDSLLLNAFPIGAVDGSAVITVNSVDYTVNPDEASAVLFDTAGEFIIDAVYTDTMGVQQNASFTVNVMAPVNEDPLYIWYSRYRSWNETVPEGAIVDAPEVEIDTLADGTRKITRLEIYENIHIVLRTKANGPILASIPTHCFAFVKTPTGSASLDEIFPDGSLLSKDVLLGLNLPDDLLINFDTYAAGLTFEDGTMNKDLYKSDFDGLGIHKFSILRSAGRSGAMCSKTRIYQNGVLLGTK